LKPLVYRLPGVKKQLISSAKYSMIMGETKKEVSPLEETKDFLTEETAAEAIPGTDTDTDGAAAAGETAGTEPDKTEAAADGEPAPAPKKKKTLQTTILISLVIVICVVLAAIVCRLFFMKGVVDTNLIGGKAEVIKNSECHYSAALRMLYPIYKIAYIVQITCYSGKFNLAFAKSKFRKYFSRNGRNLGNVSKTMLGISQCNQ
jgi:hypothetical protein